MASHGAPELQIDTAAEDETLAAGWNFPGWWYTDRRIYELERSAIFSGCWTYLSPGHLVARPGDVAVGHVGDAPVVLVRGDDRQLRGFLNVCRHRGFPVVRQHCNTKLLVCGYHAWSYEQNGRLRAAPGLDQAPKAAASVLSLVPIAVECWGESVFGNLDVKASSLALTHPELDSCADENGIDKHFRGYTFHKRLNYEVHANWKVFYDNDIECYHCPTVHPKSFNEAYVTSSGDFTWYTSASGRLMGHRFRPRPVPAGIPSTSALRSHNYRSLRMFPGFTIAQQDEVALVTQIIPLDVEHVRYVADFYAEMTAELDRIARWVNLWDQTFREDVEVCELQQQSLRTGLVTRNRIVSAREPGVLWVRDNIWRLIKARGIEPRHPRADVPV
jgi:choline monooxygenase